MNQPRTGWRKFRRRASTLRRKATSIDNIEGTASIGTSTGTRTPQDVNVTAKRMSSTGSGISGTADNFQFA